MDDGSMMNDDTMAGHTISLAKKRFIERCVLLIANCQWPANVYQGTVMFNGNGNGNGAAESGE